MTDGGNVKVMTVMGEALMDGLSDAGSTPARSTKKTSRTFCMKESYKKSGLFLFHNIEKSHSCDCYGNQV